MILQPMRKLLPVSLALAFIVQGLALLIPGLRDPDLSRWLMAGLAMAAAVMVVFVSAQRSGFFHLVERALVGMGQKAGRQSRSTVMPRRPRASSAARVALRLGSWQSPVTVAQKIAASRIASKSSSSARICRSGAVGKR